MDADHEGSLRNHGPHTTNKLCLLTNLLQYFDKFKFHKYLPSSQLKILATPAMPIDKVAILVQ